MKIRRIKIFKVIDGHQSLQDEINNWLSANPAYEPIYAALSNDLTPEEKTERNIIVLYEENA